MTSSRDTLSRFIDAAADSVARIMAAVQREAKSEREIREADYRARVAELDLRIAAVSELERRLVDRLGSIRDGEPGVAGRDGTDGRDGTSVAEDVVRVMVKAECERILATWERPKDGESLTIDDVAPAIDEAVSRAVSALPPARDGRDGVDGKDGRDGLDGKDGERGSDGSPGKLPIVSDWRDRVHYEGEVVTWGGSVFQAMRDTGKEPNHDDWRCIVVAGANGSDGKDGRSFTIRGTWLEINEYRLMDVVALNGASFVARRDNPGTCPGDGWQLLASQGKRGAPGEAGRQGMRGERGDAAQAVLAASVTDEGLLMLIGGDGATVECDLYPVLAKLKQ